MHPQSGVTSVDTENPSQVWQCLSHIQKHLVLSLAGAFTGRRHRSTSHTDAAEKEIKDRGQRRKTAALGEMSVDVATWAGAHRGLFREESCSHVIGLDLRLTEP